MAKLFFTPSNIRRLTKKINRKNITWAIAFIFALQGFWYWQSLQVSKQAFLAGMPRVENLSNYKSWYRILNNGDFLIGYSDYYLNPLWVGYKLKMPLHSHLGARATNFESDWRSFIKVKHSDFSGSGYDRGHLAPNYAIAKVYGRKAQLKTFITTNIAPQRPNLNRGAWKELEIYIMDKWLPKNKVLWVQTGTIFQNSKRMKNNFIAVPQAFYKIIATRDDKTSQIKAIAFVMSQKIPKHANFKKYMVSIDFIEQNTGLDFFADLDETEQIRLESGVDKEFWFSN